MANSILDLKEILGEYSKEVDECVYEQAKEIAKGGVDKLKNTSPINKKRTKNRGRYRKGWTMTIEKGFGTVEAIIHNKTDYQLTHLLEKPHSIRNKYGTWGTSTPKVHIYPVEQECIQDFERKLNERLKNV